MDENDIDQHPDLRDPDWQKHAVKEAWADLRRQRRRARLGKRLGWTAVSLVVVAGAVFGLVQWGRSTSAHYDGSAPPPAQIRPTAQSVLPDIAQVSLDHPFDNTPAATWSESADGLAVPPAGSIGGFSAAEVQNAVDQVKKVLTAGRLDRRTIEGRDTSVFLNLLAPGSRAYWKPIVDNRANDEFKAVLTVAADGHKLLPANPRISGNITARPGDNAHTLALHASYSVGYAFDPGSFAPIMQPGDIDAFLRYEVEFEMVKGSATKNDRGLWVTQTQGVIFSMACEPVQKGYLAPAYSETVPGGSEPSHFDETAVYDVTKPLPDFTGGCE